MVNEFLTPVSDELRGLAAELDQFSIGSSLRFDTEIAENALVILGVRDTRGGKESFNDELGSGRNPNRESKMGKA